VEDPQRARKAGWLLDVEAEGEDLGVDPRPGRMRFDAPRLDGAAIFVVLLLAFIFGWGL
jgi:hypothetical protein